MAPLVDRLLRPKLNIVAGRRLVLKLLLLLVIPLVLSMVSVRPWCRRITVEVIMALIIVVVTIMTVSMCIIGPAGLGPLTIGPVSALVLALEVVEVPPSPDPPTPVLLPSVSALEAPPLAAEPPLVSREVFPLLDPLVLARRLVLVPMVALPELPALRQVVLLPRRAVRGVVRRRVGVRRRDGRRVGVRRRVGRRARRRLPCVVRRVPQPV